MNGAFNEMANFNGMPEMETPEFMVSKMDEFGSPGSYNHYSVGWAWAMNTPVPVDQAGRLALGRHPQRDDRALAERDPDKGGGLRYQFSHVIDVAPTVLEVAGLPSRRWSTACAGADRGHEHRVHLRQGGERGGPGASGTRGSFEMFGNRGVYHDGWYASAGTAGSRG